MSEQNDNALLEVAKLHFCYEQSLASCSSNHSELAHSGLFDLNFTIKAGERVALVGANGSGKSTLLLLLSGCLKPQQGKVFLNAQDCTAQPSLSSQSVATLFQDPDNQLFMPSVKEELEFSLIHSNNCLNKTVFEQELLVQQALQSFHIQHLAERAPHHLSVGEKKRVALASLLINKPQLLLLDEPSAGLDPRSRRNLITELQNLDTALLMATHDLDLALEAASRIIILNHGRIVGQSVVPGLLTDAEFLENNGLELPLSLQNQK